MSILYRYGSTYYINLTNRCPCKCVFCVRNRTDSLGDADTLWLSSEPTAEEVMSELHSKDLSDTDEIVFCGYGEPTERLDVLLDIARRIKEELGKSVRLDTNGLGNLINGRDIVPELSEVVDYVSISLNAPDADEYYCVTRCRFGPEAYDSLMDFIRSCRESIDAVRVSVVGGYISEESEQRCAEIARELGVGFRVR